MKRNYKTCDKCNISFSLSTYNTHRSTCTGVPSYWIKRRLGILQVDSSIVCPYCKKVCINANSQRNHSRLCKLNPNFQVTYLESYRGSYKRSNLFLKAKEQGLPKPKRSPETLKKLSEANKKRTPELRQKIAKQISKTVTKKVKEGTWHTSLAEKMHYSYKGWDLHGKWELNYAKWLDGQNIPWVRCKERFEYIFENKKRYYTPDFYLTEQNIYVEIKGYKTKKDEAKWSQFPKKLNVLMKQDLLDLNIAI